MRAFVLRILRAIGEEFFRLFTIALVLVGFVILLIFEPQYIKLWLRAIRNLVERVSDTLPYPFSAQIEVLLTLIIPYAQFGLAVKIVRVVLKAPFITDYLT